MKRYMQPNVHSGLPRDLGSIPGLGRFPGGGHGNPFQYSCLENSHGQRSLQGYSPRGQKSVRHDLATKTTTRERKGKGKEKKNEGQRREEDRKNSLKQK